MKAGLLWRGAVKKDVAHRRWRFTMKMLPGIFDKASSSSSDTYLHCTHLMCAGNASRIQHKPGTWNDGRSSACKYLSRVQSVCIVVNSSSRSLCVHTYMYALCRLASPACAELTRTITCFSHVPVIIAVRCSLSLSLST